MRMEIGRACCCATSRKRTTITSGVVRYKPRASVEKSHLLLLGSAAVSSSPQASANDCIVRRGLRGSADSVARRGRPAQEERLVVSMP